MRCSGCRQPIASGRFVRAGNLAFHGPCFVCAECATPLTRGYHAAHGRPYCGSCYTARVAPKCRVCRDPIDGRYIEHRGSPLHEHCFMATAAARCDVCGEPMASWVAFQGGKAHDACYRKHVADKCDICGGPLVGKYLVDSFGNRYHEMHRAQFPECSACGRLVTEELTGGGMSLGDGRAMCRGCYSSAIRSESEAFERYRRVRGFLEGLGMDFPPYEIPLSLVGRPKLASLMGRARHVPVKRVQGCTLYEEVIQGSRVINQQASIYILTSLPSALFEGVAAHELGHAWAYLAGCPRQDLPLAEGFCNYLSYLLHENEGGDDHAFYRKQLLESPDEAYGKGFREMKRYAERRGFPALLQYMRKSTGIPFWNF